MAERTARAIRRRNTNDLLRLVHRGAPVSRQELAGESGLSLATVASIVTDLLDAGTLLETERSRNGVGRPVGELVMDAGRGFVIGVDLAETYVSVDVLDGALNVVAGRTSPFPDPDRTPVEAADAVTSTVRRAMATAGVGDENVIGVGITLPGQVDRASGRSVFAPNWGWHDVAFGDLVRARMSLPLYIDNPLKAVLVGELWAAAMPPRGDVLVLDLGTGVGVGIAIGGELVRGVSNSAGEWGHTVLVPDGRACRCGAVGCVESYVGGPGILATLRDLDPSSPLLDLDQTTAVRRLAAAERAGEPVAVAVAASTARYLGLATANLVNIFNPEIITMAGWVSETWGARLLELARPTIERHALGPSYRDTSFGLCSVRTNPASFGIATITMERDVWQRIDDRRAPRRALGNGRPIGGRS